VAAWRILVKRLYAIGGEGTRDAFEDVTVGLTTTQDALRVARAHGLAVPVSDRHRPRGTSATWRLTELGRAYCEGRAVERKADLAGTGRAGRICIVENDCPQV
jgi:hypothetical protein